MIFAFKGEGSVMLTLSFCHEFEFPIKMGPSLPLCEVIRALILHL